MRKPLRPLLPILLLPLASSWAGIVLAADLVWWRVGIQQGFKPVEETLSTMLYPYLDRIAQPLTLSVLAAFIAIVGVYRFYKHPLKGSRLSVVFLTSFFFVFSLALGSSFYGKQAAQMELCMELKGQQELTVIEDTQQYTRSRGSEAMVQLQDGSQTRVRIFWNDTALIIPKGSHIIVQVSFKPLRVDQRWLFERGCIGTLSISGIVNQGFSNGLWGAVDRFRYDNVLRIESLGGAGVNDGAALLAGVLLGNREMLQDTKVNQDFLTCGLTHLIAVSGSHLVVVAALLYWFLKRLPLGRVCEVIILIIVLALYVMLTGMQAPAIRSAIMAGVAACSVFVGRRGHAPSALTAAALIILLVYPANTYSIGFWLSVCAVVGITLFTNLTSYWIAGIGPFGNRENPGALSQGVALTITAMSATLPIAIPTFAVLSLVAPLANLIAGPLISVVLVLGMIALVVIPIIEPLGMLLLKVADFVSDICAQVASLLAQIPWASTPLYLSLAAGAVIGIGVAVLIYFTWPMPKARTLRGAAAALFVAVLISVQVAPHLSSPQLIVMDVGQGDAILIQEEGNFVLIDTGTSDTALVKALARNNVHSLQAVIITHLDDDHAGALARLRGLVPIENIYFAEGLLEYQANNEYLIQASAIVGGGQVKELTQGESLCVGSTLSLIVLWPERRALEGSNSDSLCLLLEYDEDSDGFPEQRALLTGDCEKEELTAILKRYPSLQASIIKIGHHGSRNAMAPEQIERLNCSVALISVGANNNYGHPSTAILDILEESDTRVLRTDERGDLICLFNGSKLNLHYSTMTAEP